MGRLDGKVALICGASPNNGGTIAHFMAREGASVAVNDLVRSVAEETASFLAGRGYNAVPIPADVSNPEEAERAVRETVDHFGRLDVLLNMAGKQVRALTWDLDTDGWNTEVSSYLTSGVFLTKHAARAMIDRGSGGSIIHIISDAGHQGEPGNAGYSAVKGGLLNFARAAAADLAEHGIRVNTLSPTYMEHNLWRFGEGAWRAPRTQARPVSADDFLQGIPLGRFCRASDLGYAAVFLASDESSFITGVDLPMDGGARSKYWPWRPGELSGLTVEQYVQTVTQTRYGEPVDGSG